MTTIVTRAGKGSPLTHTEVDTNFTNLNTAKLETAAIPLGTLQAPSVSFLNDSDTGIFCPQGGNSLAIATGAQYAITCTSTQAVGIKTANPQKALHVAGATRVGADDATDAFLEIGEGATGNRNSYIDIVGDTTYTDYGLRFIRNNTGANATSEIKHRGTGNLNFTTQEAGAIVFNTTNSPRVTILPAGNVGIGTSIPGQNITVQSSASGTAPTFKLQNPIDSNSTQGAANNLSAGQLLFGATGVYPLTAKIESVYNADASFGRSAKLVFSGANGTGTLTERMTIDEEGRVGIGTTGPLDSVSVASANYRGLTLETSTLANRPTITFRNTAGSGNSAYIQGNNSEIAFGRVNQDYGGHTESARLDGSGRLLVGTSSNISSSNTGAQPIVIKTGANGGNGKGLYFIHNLSGAGEYLPIGAQFDTNNEGCRSEIRLGNQNASGSPGFIAFATESGAGFGERMRISGVGGVLLPDVYNQTIALSANVFIDTDGTLKRATSSIKYKTNIETLEDQYADAVLNCRPVWYQSTSGGDNPEWGYWGFIAEEVAEIDPRLVQWKLVEQVINKDGSRDTVPLETPEPENVAYDRFVPHLLNLIKRQKEQIEAMEVRLSALEAS